MHTNPQTFHFGKKKKILFFELLLNGISHFKKWGVIRHVFSVRIKLAKQPGALIPTVSSSFTFVTAPVATGEPRFSLKAYYTGSA